MLARRKAFDIEVWQFTGEDRGEWPAWLKEHPGTAYELGGDMQTERITIQSPDGTQVANFCDWIVRGAGDELTVLSSDAFVVLYELAPFRRDALKPRKPRSYRAEDPAIGL